MPTTTDLAAHVLGVPLSDPVDLGGSARSRVLRCRVDGRMDAGSTVVVKQFLDDGDGFARELVGLALLDRTPGLMASDPDHRVLVMTDLGDPPTLADLLLGADAEAAWAGARGWARDLGRLVGASRTHVDEARRRLAATDPWNVVGDLDEGVRRLLAFAGPGCDATTVRSELRAVGRLLEPGPDDVVTPTDTCPDNAVTGADGWLFLDLEGTDVQHPALIAAYTLLPFATCWCVFDPPASLTDDLLTEFSAGLGEHAPDVVAGGWPDTVAQACGLYVVLATRWLLDGALDGRPAVGPDGRSPSFRQLLAARWRWASLNLRGTMPALADACGAAARRATEAWGPDAETTGYPAFARRLSG